MGQWLESINTIEGRREFSLEMAGMLHARRFEELQTLLLKRLEEIGSGFMPLCVNSPLTSVKISGWERLAADIIGLERKGKKCTAVGIDITGHWEGDEPGYEVSYYDDGPFSFSTSTEDSISAACVSYGAPWMGDFIELENPLTTSGLSELYGAVTGYEHRFWHNGAEVPEDFAGFSLAHWFLCLRVNQAIARDLKEIGLPSKLPVIVGDHDFGPFFNVVNIARENRELEPEAGRILDDRKGANLARYDEITDGLVAEFIEKRSILRRWWRWMRPSKRKAAIAMAEGHEKMSLDIAGLSVSQPTWKMKGKEFSAFINLFVRARSGDRKPKAIGQIKPENRNALHETFVKYGVQFGGRWVRMNVAYDREQLRDGEHPIQTGARLL